MAVKLDRIPRKRPADINIFSLADTILALELELLTLKRDMSHIKSTTTSYVNAVGSVIIPSTVGSRTKMSPTVANNSVSLTRKAEPLTSHSYAARSDAHYTVVDNTNDSVTMVRN